MRKKEEDLIALHALQGIMELGSQDVMVFYLFFFFFVAILTLKKKTSMNVKQQYRHAIPTKHALIMLATFHVNARKGFMMLDLIAMVRSCFMKLFTFINIKTRY